MTCSLIFMQSTTSKLNEEAKALTLTVREYVIHISLLAWIGPFVLFKEKPLQMNTVYSSHFSWISMMIIMANPQGTRSNMNSLNTRIMSIKNCGLLCDRINQNEHLKDVRPTFETVLSTGVHPFHSIPKTWNINAKEHWIFSSCRYWINLFVVWGLHTGSYQ